MITDDNIQVKDNKRLLLGDAGATDSYIEFNGTNLRFYDSALGAVKTLSQISGATSPTIDDAYNNDSGERTVVVDAGDISFDLNDATSDYKVVIDNITTGTITAALVVASTGAGSVITDAIDLTDAAIVNAISIGANTIKGTTAVIDFTNFDVAANGNVTVGGNLSVTGTYNVNAIAASTVDGGLTLNGNGAGGVDIGSTSTGGITLGAASTLASGKSLTIVGTEGSNMLNLNAGDARILDGSLAITDDDDAVGLALTNNTITTASLMTIDSTSLTTGKGLAMTANGVTSGSMIYLESTAAGFTGKYLHCYDGAADDFSVGLYGATIIAGNAAGTDALTITAGDLGLASGHIDLDAGKIEVDCATDLTSYIKRNQAVTTGPVMEIEATATGDDYPCLLLDQKATGAIDTLQITTDATGAGVHVTSSVVSAVGVKIDVADSATGRAVYADLGPWLGSVGQGALEIVSDSAATVTAGMMMRLNQQGTGQHASAIDGSVIYVADEATAPGAGTSYAVTIKATNIEALHVDVGRVVLDEGVDIIDSGTLRLGTGNDLSITSNGTNVHATNTGTFTIGDGGTTNYANFAANTGKLTFVGTARVTQKEFVGAGEFMSHTGSPALTQVGTGLVFGWALDAAADESITALWRVPQDWDSSTAITAKVFWAANAVAGDAIFDLATIGLVSSESVNVAGNVDSVTMTTDGTAYDLNITSALTIAAVELAAGDMMAINLNRDANNAADTLAADALILGVEFTYTSNALGS